MNVYGISSLFACILCNNYCLWKGTGLLGRLPGRAAGGYFENVCDTRFPTGTVIPETESRNLLEIAMGSVCVCVQHRLAYCYSWGITWQPVLAPSMDAILLIGILYFLILY